MASAPFDPRAAHRQAWQALIILSAISLLNYYDRMLVVVVSQPLRLEFDLSDTEYGLLTGPAFVIVYALASLLFGVLADRYNRRKVIAAALALWSAMTALCGIAKSFPVLAAARAGVGVGEGGCNPAGLSLISDHFPPERRPFALAIFNAGGMIGLFLSFVLGSAIVAAFDWRAVFLIAGIPGLLLALVALKWLKEPPRGRFDAAGQAAMPYAQALRTLWRNKAYVWLCIAASLGVFSSLGMLIWLPQYFIRTHGMGQAEVGFLFGPAAALGLFAGMMAGGWIADRMARTGLERPVLLCISANLALVPIYLVVLWSGSVTLALIATFAAMATSVLYAPAFQATMQTVLVPGARATGAAVSNVLNSIIGQGAIPLLVGVASDAMRPTLGQGEALRWSLTGAIVFALLCGLAFIPALRATRRQVGTQPPAPPIEGPLEAIGG